MDIQNSKDITAQYLRALVLGPPGVGKTFACATISEHFKERGLLKDVLWFLFDDGGLDGFAEYGIDVPVFDFTKMGGPQLTKGIREAVAKAKERVMKGETKAIIVDSISVFNSGLLAHFMALYEKWSLYNALFKEHSLFFNNVKKLPCHMLFVCHEKYLHQSDDDAQIKKAQVDGVKMGAKVMDITGQGVRAYRANCSLILPMKATRGSSGVERVFLPHSTATESKSRFACLGEREPADFSLLLAKIQKAAREGGQNQGE